MAKSLTVALLGNPNCGKTALFNALTGSRQHVGNWPGVTVECKFGYFQEQGQEIQVVDLPGIYSTGMTNAAAVDERITCDYLLSAKADLLVNVIDASNLVRNLYLTLQLLEMGLPVVVAVNMMDIAEKRGITFNLKRLTQLTGCAVVSLVANQGRGVAELQQTLFNTMHTTKKRHFSLPLAEELQHSTKLLAQSIQVHYPQKAEHALWLASRLLEQDYYAEQQVNEAIQQHVQVQQHYITQQCQEDADILIADARYCLANHIADKVTTLTQQKRRSVTEIIDRVVLNRVLAIPLFLGVMYLMFLFAINVGGVFQDFFNASSALVFIDGLTTLLNHAHCPAWLVAILANGFGRGINTVMTFTPVIGAMFLFLAFLEDCGYMARAAFVMDRFMQLLGLPGRSFVPMIIGFGCNVPAVMGARTLANPRDRLLTILMMPFMSCGARLAIFSVFASAFFPHSGAGIIFLLYWLGILVAVLSGLVLRKTVLQGQPAALVMELPSYHLPRLGSLLRHAWQRLKDFVWRAGKYIVPICVVIGVLNSISIQGHLVPEGDRHSVLSHMGRAVTPVFAPMGISQENWPATVGLVTGILAKEVVIGTLNALYGDGQQTKEKHLWNELKVASLSVPENLLQLGSAAANPILASAPPHEMSTSAYGVMLEKFDGKVGAFAYLLFVLLYFPCVSTMAAMRREVSARWAYFSVCWSTGLAYALAVICYQALTIFFHPASSLLWVGSMLGLLLLTVLMMRRYAAQDNHSNGNDQPKQVSDAIRIT